MFIKIISKGSYLIFTSLIGGIISQDNNHTIKTERFLTLGIYLSFGVMMDEKENTIKIQSESNIKRREIYPFSCKASVINYLFFNCVVPGLMAQAFIWITSICFEGFKFPSFKAYIVTLLVIFSLAIVFLLVVLILNNVLDGYHYTITNDRLFIPKYEFRKKSFSLLFYLSHFDNLENKYFHSIPVKKIRQVKVGQGPIQKKINLYSLFIVLQYGSKIKLQMSMPFDMCEKIKSAIDNSEK